MSLTQGLVFALTMLVLFGGLFYTIWVMRQEPRRPAPIESRKPSARPPLGRS